MIFSATLDTGAEVLVVGAGPAGLTAATVASERGLRTIVLDDNPRPGGQIWRGGLPSHAGRERNSAREAAIDRFGRSGATLIIAHRVFDAEPERTTLHAVHETAAGAAVVSFRYKHLILATGARERFLPFPGWTLPGVYGAGGLQALVQGGYDVRGKRIVVAGTGPLLLAVAAHLKSFGAEIRCVAEQAGAVSLAGLLPHLLRDPGKLMQGAGYGRRLWGSAFHTGCWVTRAVAGPTGSLQSVRLTDGDGAWDEPCDLLACGFHLVPNTELPALLGCALGHGFVKIDEAGRTSLPGVFCVGEPTGIAGLEAARIQGEIAALTCAGLPTTHLAAQAAKQRRFGEALDRAFALRDELKAVPTPETIVCRCEDVPLGRVQGFHNWTDAKLQTRCGMGPCQGRICGPALETLLGWKPVSIRPPLFPVPLAAFCSHPDFQQETPKEIV